MQQQNLFTEKNAPQKIELLENFISEGEEARYLELFKSVDWQKVQMHGVVAKRRVAHYGLAYTYTKRSVQKTKPAPTWLDSLTAKAAGAIAKEPAELKEILITYYPVGAGIGWHKDAEVFGDKIIGVSFLSDCTMKFRNPITAEVHKIFIPRRSAYIFSSDARWKWQHSISNHKEDRYSVTFRTI